MRRSLPEECRDHSRASSLEATEKWCWFLSLGTNRGNGVAGVARRRLLRPPFNRTPLPWRLPMPMRRVPRTVFGLVCFLLVTVFPLHAQTPMLAEVLAEIPGTVILGGGGKADDAARTRFVDAA